MAGADDRTDEALVDACNAGDAAAFDELYRRHRDWAVRVAYRFSRDREDALDAMQDSFEYLLSKFPGFRLTARLTTFLYIVIKHNALARRQKRRRLTLGNVPETAAAFPTTTDGSAGLAAIIERLPDPQREVLLMRVVDGMSVLEVAAALSIPVGTVKSRLHHALDAIRADPEASRLFGPDSGI